MLKKISILFGLVGVSLFASNNMSNICQEAVSKTVNSSINKVTINKSEELNGVNYTYAFYKNDFYTCEFNKNNSLKSVSKFIHPDLNKVFK